MAAPDDPAVFVAAVADAVARRDADAIVGRYAPDARLEIAIGGETAEHRGTAAIHAAWLAALWSGGGGAGPADAPTRTLVSAAGDMVVSAWAGGVAGGPDARGVETWRFAADGRVADHTMHGSRGRRGRAGIGERLRLAAVGPLAALRVAATRGRRER